MNMNMNNEHSMDMAMAIKHMDMAINSNEKDERVGQRRWLGRFGLTVKSRK
jgi:hypothetical protein